MRGKTVPADLVSVAGEHVFRAPKPTTYEENTPMSISQVRPFVGKRCAIRWTDRSGNAVESIALIETTRFVPMYGAYLVTPTDELRLDKITEIEPLD